jgi:2,3,4,5-tetrahydropyridine-2-carboxylate N-succinyltransferase
MSDPKLRQAIEALWERRDSVSSKTGGADRAAVDAALAALESGEQRAVEPTASGWVVNEWLKKAVLLSFRLYDSVPMPGAGGAPVFDKVPM